MDTDDEHSIVCISGKDNDVDGGNRRCEDLVGLEVEGNAEKQPRQKSITRRGTCYQTNQHCDSSSDDEE